MNEEKKEWANEEVIEEIKQKQKEFSMNKQEARLQELEARLQEEEEEEEKKYQGNPLCLHDALWCSIFQHIEEKLLDSSLAYFRPRGLLEKIAVEYTNECMKTVIAEKVMEELLEDADRDAQYLLSDCPVIDSELDAAFLEGVCYLNEDNLAVAGYKSDLNAIDEYWRKNSV